MSPEEKRIAIANACGAKWYLHDSGCTWLSFKNLANQFPSWRWTEAPADSSKIVIGDTIPDYPGSSDAIREAIKSLSSEQRHCYSVVLAAKVWPPHQGWQGWEDTLRIVEAPVDAHVFAILIAIGHEL